MYEVQSPIKNAFAGMNQAAGTFGAMTKDVGPEKPKPTAGGAIMSGAGGAMMGSQIAGMTAGSTAAGGAAAGSAGGYWGAAIGAIVGIGAYLLS